MKLAHLVLKQTTHRHDRLSAPFIIDDGKVANVFLNHDLESLITGRSQGYCMNRRGHHFFNPCLSRIAMLQHNPEHNVPFAEDSCQTTVIDDKNTANARGSHDFDRFHHGGCSRNRDYRSAVDGHRLLLSFRNTDKHTREIKSGG